MSGQLVTAPGRISQLAARRASQPPAIWQATYLRQVAVVDCVCAIAAAALAYELRFDHRLHIPDVYLAISVSMPLLWVTAMAIAGGYDSRFIGVGSDEFRRVLNGGVTLTAAVAIVSYATKAELARGYVVIALPCVTLFALIGRLLLRKRLHRQRRLGGFMRKVVVVGHAAVATDLARMLRRESYHGLSVVAACLADLDGPADIAGIPATSGLDDVAEQVARHGADTVAVLACPEMSGARLRELAWELEKTGTDLCVAPALLDVAGPRTTIRPVAGLPLLHLDHPEFTGARRVVKDGFDRALACGALVLSLPMLIGISVVVRITDGGPALFRQTRLGGDGRPFTLYKFRTMVVGADRRKTALAAQNEMDHASLLFKIRKDPRLTPIGGWLRRWSVDELPQLLNVVKGDMSLVGPRPWTSGPYQNASYDHFVARRLAVKPGITGLWQVSGRADLSWDESVRLDLRYVENWSLALDLQILWKTIRAVIRHAGAY